MKKISLFILALCSFSEPAHTTIAWSPPTTISTGQVEISDPRVVIDSRGNVTAAWVENSTIKTSSLPLGENWSEPVTLSNDKNIASKPKLGVDLGGNVTALWIEDTLVQTTTLPFGGSWNPEITAISYSGASNPTLAVDDTDNAVAVWVRDGFIESSTRVSGRWSSFTAISEKDSNNPHLAISECGIAIAAWKCITEGVSTIFSDILTINTNIWEPARKIFNGSENFLCDFPKTAIDAHGNATVAWFKYNLVKSNSYQNVQINTSSLPIGYSFWEIPTTLSKGGIRNPSDLIIKLRVDLNGDVLAVWTNSYDGENFTIESSLKPFGGIWPRSILPQTPSLYSFGLDLAFYSGSTLLTNMAWDGDSKLQILSQGTDTTNSALQAWSMINPFSTGNDNGYPQCAMCSIKDTFHTVAVWIYFDGQNNFIHASTGMGKAIEPPSNINVSQNVTNFGFYQDYFNIVTWEASSNPDLMQYTIFRNGVYFNATDPDTLQFVNHNVSHNESVTYGIAALTSYYRQSEIVSYTLFP